MRGCFLFAAFLFFCWASVFLKKRQSERQEKRVCKTGGSSPGITAMAAGSGPERQPPKKAPSLLTADLSAKALAERPAKPAANLSKKGPEKTEEGCLKNGRKEEGRAK